jgi:hypothetical protein
MTSWRLGPPAAAAVLLLSSTCFAQAVAEGALTHALSSSMASGIGTSLGKATNQLSGKVGQQVSNIAPSPRGVSTKKNQPGSLRSTTMPGPAAASASFIASIQGGETRDASCVALSATGAPDSKTKIGASRQSADTNNERSTQRSQTGCPAAASDPENHPSVVNLPAAK